MPRPRFRALISVMAVALASCSSYTVANYQTKAPAQNAADVMRSFAIHHGFHEVAQASPPPQMARGLGSYIDSTGRDTIAIYGYDCYDHVIITLTQSGSQKSDRFAQLEQALRVDLAKVLESRVEFTTGVRQLNL
jgi:hypothetical protein